MKMNGMKRMMAAAFAGMLAAGIIVTDAPVKAAPDGSAQAGAAANASEYDLNTFAQIPVIPDGITIMGEDVGGKSGEDVIKLVEDRLKKDGEKVLHMELADETAELTMKDLGLNWETAGEVAGTILDASCGNLIVQYKAGKDIDNGAIDTDMVYGIDSETAREAIEEIVSKFDLEPTNATAKFENGQIIVTPDEIGVDADIDGAVELIEKMIADWDQKDIDLEIPAEIIEADIKADYYEGMHLISSFSTDYWSEGTPYSPGRNKNVQQGAANVNGRWFAPGEEISTLNMIGPVKAETGFMLAGVYSDGDSQPQYGGGLCQVATTLYNAYLKIELEEVYRRPHSSNVSYVPLAMDAMVFPQGGKDFIVRNSTGHPLYIEMFCAGHDLIVNLYGVYENPANRQVVYQSVTNYDIPYETIDTPDPSLKIGQVVYDRGGHNSCQATLYKQVYIDGVMTENTALHTDTYKTMTAKRRYGPAIDSNGVSYYIDNQGYAVGADGTKYRLNEDGTWLDNPVPEPEESSEAESSEKKEDKKED